MKLRHHSLNGPGSNADTDAIELLNDCQFHSATVTPDASDHRYRRNSETRRTLRINVKNVIIHASHTAIRGIDASAFHDLERFKLAFAGEMHLFPDELRLTGGKRKFSEE